MATICVPISTPQSAASKRRSTAPALSSPSRMSPPAAAPAGLAAPSATTSASRRKTGKAPSSSSTLASSCWRRSVPAPWRATARGAALRAARRRRLAVAAVVAGDVPAAAVQHERDVAVGAAPHPSAGAAGEEVRPAAAVEQHDRLAARGADVRERLRGERVQALRLAAHVEHLHRGQRPPVDAVGEHRRGQAVDALRPRRGAAGEQHRAAARGALGGDVARVVARVALVLVGGVVLLVDDDQPEIVDRREHGRARPDAHARLAARAAAATRRSARRVAAGSAAPRRCRRSVR